MEGLSLSMPIICELTLPKNDYRFYLQIFFENLASNQGSIPRSKNYLNPSTCGPCISFTRRIYMLGHQQQC